MSRLLSRRRFMMTGASAVAASALPAVAGRASANSSGELRVNVSGGDFGKAAIDAYVKPFEAESGIKVTPIAQVVHSAQIAMMVKAKAVTVDVVPFSPVPHANLVKDHLFEEIDYSIYNKEELDAIPDYCKQPYGIASDVYSYNMVYNVKKFPAGKPRPTSWAEFWDAQRFPGTRSLQNGQYGTVGPWEEALLADGVPVDKLYPMDIDRIFRSLDKIKPHIVKWWTSGSEIQQIMRDDVADIVQSYDERALLLIENGEPIEINRNQAKLVWQYWSIPKGSPNAQNAQKFIEFVTRAEPQAALARLFPQAPTNRNALKLLPEKLSRNFSTHPDYMATSYPINPKWYIETGADGLTNVQRLVQHWNQWILH
ncbi:ABC transporter substrate-binding protein [Bradyrhizobium sp. ISRA443]|uniref:ABC transporter substrate-binding protein n=1 Tax=unclassified Bradyrhizobium TaxID=2631580 RepID=UPI0024797763|nr:MULTISPECIES: ABC transporter substrate-binding protein [unclassified Bradyrhizobium]WGR97966.1 ABC transporter substrate-binding protein [Bradyrhizobium sp. ISRA436]WGS04856.1 ABC transporter substrate-binding protein [Bradyrhizobium sp. ISRA437]WGS11737.1 ABC transporter substrate-binding protein [Bradyrhizobium sp. ISRA443]